MSSILNLVFLIGEVTQSSQDLQDTWEGVIMDFWGKGAPGRGKSMYKCPEVEYV